MMMMMMMIMMGVIIMLLPNMMIMMSEVHSLAIRTNPSQQISGDPIDAKVKPSKGTLDT